ncbi:hypothetical protein ACT2CR_00400 [Candidatus Vidania fulgoroideorum]
MKYLNINNKKIILININIENKNYLFNILLNKFLKQLLILNINNIVNYFLRFKKNILNIFSEVLFLNKLLIIKTKKYFLNINIQSSIFVISKCNILNKNIILLLESLIYFIYIGSIKKNIYNFKLIKTKEKIGIFLKKNNIKLIKIYY